MFYSSRKNHARAMESVQASLESEQKAKQEALRIKKKIEGDINELEIALDHANKANNEAGKSMKRYQAQLREAESGLEEVQRVRQEVVERASLAERRANALQGEMEEARALLDSADRGKRQTELELSEARNAVTEMNGINSRAAADKRSVEGAVHTLHAEIDDMLNQAKGSEEKAKARPQNISVNFSEIFSLRKRWLTPPGWLTSCEPSRSTPTPWELPSGPWRSGWQSWS